MLSISFTGTRRGMTLAQVQTISSTLDDLTHPTDPQKIIAHHGMCIGADTEFHHLCRSRNFILIGHPGTKKDGTCSTRASVTCNQILPAKPFLSRDRDIVDASPILLATPLTFLEILRSGTWTIIRYARHQCKQILIILPDGTLKQEN